MTRTINLQPEQASEISTDRDIRNVVCPLWSMPYESQLCFKHEKVEDAMCRLTRAVAKKFKQGMSRGLSNKLQMPGWVSEANKVHRGCAAPVLGIVRSPVLDGYRNKSEFSVGLDLDGNPTVGFNVGLFKEGITAVSGPENCRHISPIAKILASALQSFIRSEMSEIRQAGHQHLPVWNKSTGTGFWRLLTVREGGGAPSAGHWCKWMRTPRTDKCHAEGHAQHPHDEQVGSSTTLDDNAGLPSLSPNSQTEVMVIIQVSPSGYDARVVQKACKRAADILRLAASRASLYQFSLKRLLMQVHNGVSNAAGPDAELFDLEDGNKSTADQISISENLCGLRFSLSATAFFQVNTSAADALYQIAGEWASPHGRSLVLDICCGTGTIGITIAKKVHKVIGIDIVEGAIKDAKANASLNGITNCEWIAGKAENVLPSILSTYAPLVAPSKRLAATKARYSAPSAEESGSEGEVRTDQNQQSKHETTMHGKVLWSSKSFSLDEIVAIVDPPRAGLHRNVLSALRKEPSVRRLVYVSCNPDSMTANCAELCTPQGPDGRSGGVPFSPIKALAVDLFPHTRHCEAVILLER